MADFHKQTPKKGAESGAAQTKSPVALSEEKVLQFWREKNIFKKTLEKPSPGGNFVFYDGPPFATGLPHYGHILISAIKDAVPRYQTMRGKHVERRWGWDCHGLPIENIVEKDLKVSGKKEIEELGIDRFNEYARSKVLDYADHWRDTIERIGRWVDYDGAYMTMNNSFIESVWWSLKGIWDKKLIYEGTKVLPYCPRCETPISNSEIAMDNSYKDITDISVYVKLAVENEPRTYLLVWTTTPWTLPGNTAAAVNPELDYVIGKMGDDYYIVGKEKIGIFKEKFEVVEEIKGSALVGKKYKPPFDYFTGTTLPNGQPNTLQNKENGWKVYAAPYVTAQTGSGIVHLAPAYGEEDMALAREHNIPFVRHVGHDGKFTADVTDFAGQKAKPKEDHQSGDVLIIKNLAARDLLFAKEKITHSYPHCYRCETPLYYFALPAWFVKISEVKKRLIALNEDISWSPAHLKHGRFGKSVEAAPDWNISRNRYWASPLPFWTCQKCGQTDCVGSLEEITKRSPAKNKYFVMRHGEAEFNLIDKISYSPNDNNHVTEKGKAEAVAAAAKIKEMVGGSGVGAGDIDFIYASDLVRTLETAEIVAKELGLSADKIFYSPEIRELNAGVYGGKTWDEYRAAYPSVAARFDADTVAEGSETLLDVRDRAVKFVYDLEKKHVGKKILIISHGDTIFFMQKGVKGLSKSDLITAFANKPGMIGTGVVEALDFAPIPHNKNFELDLHRPYVDDIVFKCKCGGEMRRIPEVIDCWFESGSMPFAQNHYPFENREKFEKNFPGDFVAEYIAQTRTWFYYMHAVSTILFDKYGVDALRFYLLGSPLLKSEDLNFSEKGVDEVYKKIILRLKNVVTFYETYAAEDASFKEPIKTMVTPPPSKNILDRWIVERINIVVAEVTTSMEAYKLDQALAHIDSFIDDLSVWYLRRSRERLKDENPDVRDEALKTFRAILFRLSKIMAPFTPFIAEEIYRSVNGEKESVHLEDWPTAWVTPVEDMELISDMLETRRVVSLALEARAKAGIKVRQPLAKLVVKSTMLQNKNECTALIADETNIKEISFDADLADEVALDTEISPMLREEGNLRELIRFIQELRKKTGLKPGELAVLEYEADSDGKEFITRFESEIKKVALLSAISLSKVDNKEGKVEIDNAKFEFVLRK